MRRVALMPVAALTAVIVSSCTSTSSGVPSPASTQGGGPSWAPSSGTTSNWLTGRKGCDVLGNAEAQQAVPGAGAGVDQGARGGTGTSDCEWTKPASDASGSVVFGVTVRPNQGLDDVVADVGVSSRGTIGSHQARQVKGNGGEGSCLLAIAVGSGRVDISADTTRITSDETCDIVGKVADIVEPKLPA